MATVPSISSGWEDTTAKAQVASLVADYERARADGRLSHFSEEATKKDYILPLFRALGWRVEDSTEVSAEERILRGRADYGFKIGGVTRFYVEAKTLSKNLLERENLQQVIDYSYAKGVSWAVLTNFAHTVVLYSEVKEANPFNSRFIELSAAEYVASFDRLRLLSRNAVASNELDSKAEAFGRKPKKQPIDKQLLNDLNSFRLELAKDIQRLNADQFRQSDEALEETIQRILDRLIFIRVAEDRELEDRQLALLSKAPESTVLKGLRQLFQRYDENFDSKLFQPHAADEVRIDGAVLQRLFRGLHETVDGTIRYDFGAIDADVLGVMYEQYLGLILRQSAKRARLSGGVANRKEQGIYYTPTWVVDYIVGHAVDEALRRKGSKSEKLRILDPACGSGTFLLRAFDHVMRARNPTRAPTQARFDPETAGPLLALRTSVLTDNLFGIDLDPRAVEITQLNLMIRAAETRHRLPTLERNVRVGNSIISDSLVDSRALDWREAFPLPAGEGGFDIIVGNPPYLNVKRGFFKDQQCYFEKEYATAQGQYDLYRVFIERSVRLLKPGGVLGFIIPKRAFVNENEIALRRHLLKEGRVLRIADVGAAFDDAAVETAIIIFQKTRPEKAWTIQRDVADVAGAFSSREPIPLSQVTDDPNLTVNLVTGIGDAPLRTRIETESTPLGEMCTITRGIEAGKKTGFLSSSDTGFPLLFGEEVTRFASSWAPKWVKFSTKDPSVFKDERLYRQPAKLLVRRVADDLIATVDYDSRFVLNTLYVFQIHPGVTPEYLCGLLNSKLLRFWFRSRFVLTEKLFPYVRKSQLEQVPIRVGRVPDIEAATRKLLKLTRTRSALPSFRTDRSDALSHESDALQEELDSLVFDVYGVSPEDRKAVEAALSARDSGNVT